MNDARGSAKIPRQKRPFDRILGHQYTIFDGLAGMQVEDIYQDQRGLLWIATADGGVSRFDGAHFDTFGLSDGAPQSHGIDHRRGRRRATALWYAGRRAS